MYEVKQSELWIGGQGLSGSGRAGTEADLDTLTEWKWITVRMGKRG